MPYVFLFARLENSSILNRLLMYIANCTSRARAAPTRGGQRARRGELGTCERSSTQSNRSMSSSGGSNPRPYASLRYAFLFYEHEYTVLKTLLG